MRDGGRRSADGPRNNARSEAEGAKASKAHRAALDALFAKGELGKYAEKMGLGGASPKPAEEAKPAAAPKADPEAKARSEKETEKLALRKKLVESIGRDAIGRAFDKFVKAYGMPSEWELLEKGLEHPNDDKLVGVMTAIEAALDREKPRRTRTLDGLLRFIAETHSDSELRARASAIRARL